jgi:predicted nucleic acid-binding protein
MSDALPVLAIDANVILRYLLRDNEQQYERAAAILQAVDRGEARVACDPVTLAEVVWVLSARYGLPNHEISEGLAPLVKAEGFVMPAKGRYIRALELFAGSVKHFGDACACATALEGCEGRLYSFDRKLSSVAGIQRTESVAG